MRDRIIKRPKTAPKIKQFSKKEAVIKASITYILSLPAYIKWNHGNAIVKDNAMKSTDISIPTPEPAGCESPHRYNKTKHKNKKAEAKMKKLRPKNAPASVLLWIFETSIRNLNLGI
ncbi:hypothetical protein [Aliiglaciecola litoralis]|uniref:BHLH domain-containing protein n=1 Tax=Aliiglaciecola litoralis TaxID=582857 RepID=A0ABP3X4B5_9ALTE